MDLSFFCIQKFVMLWNTMYKVKLIGTFLTYDKDKSLKDFLKYKKNHDIFYKEEKIK